MNHTSRKHREEWNMVGTHGWRVVAEPWRSGGGGAGTGIKVSASALRTLLTYWLSGWLGFGAALHGVM